ncbi:MAG: response regulator transcription factor [Cytophagales bacterium]|nr:response regulator transcription factor [Cytophagales bacterium]
MKEILIVEDHPIFSDGLQNILADESSISLLDKLADGNLVIPFLAKNKVDLILLDINLPGIDGLSLLKEIKATYPDIKVLILTQYDKAAFIQSSIESGADGYLLKNSSKNQVLGAVSQVLSGEPYFSQEAMGTLISSMRRQGTNHQVKLTKRETEVMTLLAKGLTVNELADKLFISAHTAETHRRNVMAKMKFKNRAELTVYATEHGYLDLPKGG